MTITTASFDLEPLALPADVPADIRVWRVPIPLTIAPDDPACAALDASERARAARYLRPEDAARFSVMRAALRQVLATLTGGDPARLKLDAGENGRPLLDEPDAPDFNVSHSGSYGLIGVSRARRVGVDIEAARTGFGWRELAPAVLAERDRQAIEALPEAARQSAFFDCWTAKEAVLKAHGVGIGGGWIGLKGFSVLPREGLRHAVSPEAEGFAAIALDAPSGYAAALAWQV
ncbi:4'-phosphopantetheinyl transferase superfamily protein [Caballeronia sp. LZ033]|uniref:4'-phosphopantetheinyl transferase family protein n=1 Tax=Caballeronia sp. LZ033 TaxID=3038566 RepID=UPI00285D4941|nr:4'-phosphopantetheinyl transferase superfamily protein [Caballeronia sp. LZ033]MDR5817695.1 4'-phosphopantetheinyl transferase superfamily protein [Caballeronia sp. LZ033]